MPLQLVTFERFSGLWLPSDPGEATGAISMLNADLSVGGTQVRSRGGVTRLGTGTAPYHYIAAYTDSLLAAWRNTGSVVQTETVALSGGTVTTIPGATWGSSTTRVTSAVTKTGPAM